MDLHALIPVFSFRKNSQRDFFSNPVDDGSVDFGVYEQIGSGVFPNPLAEKEFNRIESAKSSLALAKRIFPKVNPNA